jgi:hypothetical protein
MRKIKVRRRAAARLPGLAAASDRGNAVPICEEAPPALQLISHIWAAEPPAEGASDEEDAVLTLPPRVHEHDRHVG